MPMMKIAAVAREVNERSRSFGVALSSFESAPSPVHCVVTWETSGRLVSGVAAPPSGTRHTRSETLPMP